MKRIQYHRYGGPETMKLEDFALRTPGKGEVAVKVAFAAINPIDWKVRNGALKMVTGKTFPRALGSDFSGTVISVGPGVTRVKIGDAVFGLAQIKEGGAIGEAVIAPETFLAKKPDSLSFEDAACLGTPGVTAWNGLVDKAGLKRGQRVFINGCSGSVGETAVQIARMLGATVSGSCSAEGAQRARDLGVETVFDYRTTDLSKISERYDVVYDTSATMEVAVGLGLLRKGGVFLDINPTPAKFIRALFYRRLKPIVCSARADILDGLARAAGEGKLKLPVAKIVPLKDAIPLVTALEQGRKLPGKGLVSID
ncbi:NAD(P)-dependent alcohol dehydrogenase (plasmid) [Rhizobium ruizarguesonis]|uniref:NAD(P)-dependent alcohol dehydrogenase n=1 Tax=Rhizobium ruizarguesonis TaxID=2081791 RepID=A0ABY1WVM6_9HYPH|nr:NAD(P)-dependent alcohol dehydrogenase [Rhizobium ruizarguesonis]TAU17059.1 NAD(P)-dependent alcohol dehydrogenase [Rhizobium ruizarguesonis]TAU56931.1 NAD(P)-dependent alcohol dehydrogenase [Rhizobium ruizarguesonis]TAU71539.1 NAD(P)-dependent alcohol dehydrogenase [Rhizobium ruizarguesonis]TAV01661.1 NAD(P)-dependent alcohol dehydrogenase [Rhizobium ruizarguesonis]TAV21771.1 NAD(P)-dependent alcohol dehydrogenase [Rhizobium ruizarguesonis]